MRKIKVFAHISLDGVIAPGGPNDNSDYANGGWTAPYRSPDGAQAVTEAQGESFDLLLGRRTYDLWASFWPKQSGGPFATNINAATKYVATHRAESLDWGPAKDLGSDVVAGIHELKSGDGPDLVSWGSTTVTSVLFAQGLVDELVLVVYPLLFGQGKRCFPAETTPREFSLIDSKTMSTGALVSTYRQVGLARAS